jgi:hypothetical protein
MNNVTPIRRTISIGGATMQEVTMACLRLGTASRRAGGSFVIDEFDTMKRYARILMHPKYFKRIEIEDQQFILRALKIKRGNVRRQVVIICNIRLANMVEKYVKNRPQTCKSILLMFSRIKQAFRSYYGKH